MEEKETHVLFVEEKQIASLHDGRNRNKDMQHFGWLISFQLRRVVPSLQRQGTM